MEKFDKIIKEKLLSFPTEEKPNDAAFSKMMGMLDLELPLDSKPGLKKSGQSSRKTIFLFYRIAASVAFVVLSFYALNELNEVTIEVGKTAYKKVELPDKSTVEMNADSKIHYNKFLWNFARKVTFEGEGFFEVQKGGKFEIYSSLGVTQILGTSFNIYSREGKYKVECFSGKVKVTSLAIQKDHILNPGDGIVIHQSDAQTFSHLSLPIPKWLEGEFYFEDENVEDVIAELERQFNLEISFPEELKNQKYTGYFDNKDQEKALKLVCEPLGLQYTRKGKLLELSFIE